jgi:hypothetical protein
MMWEVRILFPLQFVVFKQTACHFADTNVGQLSEFNLDPDVLTNMVSIIVNKLAYKPSVHDHGKVL